MGRPPAHTVDDFLDAAVRLFSAGGARAVTMSSVAREVGAPSGSVYHRFADRPALLAAVWLRTVRRFQADWLAAVDAEPVVDAAIEAATRTVDWCREHVDDAVVLYAGKRALSHEDWSAAAREELLANDATRDRRLGRMMRRVAADTGRTLEEVSLAVIDLPYAVSRRYLANGQPPPPGATDLVARTARMILQG